MTDGHIQRVSDWTSGSNDKLVDAPHEVMDVRVHSSTTSTNLYDIDQQKAPVRRIILACRKCYFILSLHLPSASAARATNFVAQYCLLVYTSFEGTTVNALHLC